MAKWPVPKALAALFMSIIVIKIPHHTNADNTGTSNPKPQSSENSSNPSLIAVILYINAKSSSRVYNYSFDEGTKTSTFTAAPRYKFVKALKSGGTWCCFPGCCDKTIWESGKDVNDYSTKVEVKNVGSSNKTVVVYLSNGGTKTYNRPGKCKNWSEITENASTKS